MLNRSFKAKIATPEISISGRVIWEDEEIWILHALEEEVTHPWVECEINDMYDIVKRTSYGVENQDIGQYSLLVLSKNLMNEISNEVIVGRIAELVLHHNGKTSPQGEVQNLETYLELDSGNNGTTIEIFGIAPDCIGIPLDPNEDYLLWE